MGTAKVDWGPEEPVMEDLVEVGLDEYKTCTIEGKCVRSIAEYVYYTRGLLE